MGEFDFTYELPNNFRKRVVQFLQQSGEINVAEAFQRCEYAYENVGLAYYAGLVGDNWNKEAVDFTLEGLDDDITILKNADRILKDAIGKALRSSVSGYLVRNIIYFISDIFNDSTNLHASNEERLNADIATANNVLCDLIKIGERVCLNSMYDATSSENSINDYFRDMLFSSGYNEVKDQTRHGVSASGKDAGEVDILLTKANKEIAIFEGLKLNSVRSEYINEHINKAITNYNALGTATFVVAYVSTEDFEGFWNRYINHIKEYHFTLGIKKELDILVHPNASTRVATMILTRDGFDFPVYFIAFKII